MLSLIFYMLSIGAFSLYAAFKLNKRFEESIAVGTMGVVLLLFLFGMVRLLYVGALVIMAATLVTYAYLAYFIFKNKSCIKAGCQNIFTAGFFWYMAVAALIFYISKGRLAVAPDEMSHWVDTVKIMSIIDAFGTDARSWAIFPSYPPAMSLLQYYSQKLYVLFGGVDFCEWRLYFVYKTFAISLMVPFISMGVRSVKRQVLRTMIFSVVLFVPLMLFCDFYSSCYIDAFLGIAAGSGLAMVFLARKRDYLYVAYVAMVCAVLVLAKDVGSLLAFVIAAGFLVDGFASKRFVVDVKSTSTKALHKRIPAWVYWCIPLASLLVAKYLWKLNLKVSGTPAKFSQPFEVDRLFDVLRGRGDDFCTAVLEAYRHKVLFYSINIGQLGFNYVSLLVAIAVGLFATVLILYRRDLLTKAQAIMAVLLPTSLMVFYLLGLFPLYISRFSTDEALALASFDRYVGIVILTALICLSLLLTEAVAGAGGNYYMTVAATALALLWLISINKANLAGLLSRESVAATHAVRGQYDILAGKLLKHVPEYQQVYVVLPGDDGTMAQTLSFMCGSIDVLDSPTLADYHGQCGFVAVFSVDDSLADYIQLFAEPESINANCLYQLSGDGKLVMVE